MTDDKIDVLYKGEVVARARTAEEAVQIIRMLSAEKAKSEVAGPGVSWTAPPAPPPAPAPPLPQPTGPWTLPATKAFVNSLTPIGRGMTGAIQALGVSTMTEIAGKMGKENGKGIGPARRLVEKRAEERGLPSPFVDTPDGKLALTPEFRAALGVTGLKG